MLVVAVLSMVIACFFAGATCCLAYGVFVGHREMRAIRAEMAQLRSMQWQQPFVGDQDTPERDNRIRDSAEVIADFFGGAG